ncbi:MAG: hypothetical protein DRP72_02125 [Candidatus Omnitrophota bacterium]|nr:MAG: hypothetical protein DRP72_02125 [Candidatus Omnitrophota bacterium]
MLFLTRIGHLLPIKKVKILFLISIYIEETKILFLQFISSVSIGSLFRGYGFKDYLCSFLGS